jgi:hypothetical protein
LRGSRHSRQAEFGGDEAKVTVRWDFDHANRFVYVTAEGDVYVQEVLDCYDQFVVQNAMSYAKLWDARTADLKFSDEDVMTLGAWTSAYAEFDPRGPIAIVALTDDAWDMMRRYMAVGEANRPLRLFTSVDQARQWLDDEMAARKPSVTGPRPS